ncbi:hypothetical protein [Nocardia sp. IFM 10818]
MSSPLTPQNLGAGTGRGGLLNTANRARILREAGVDVDADEPDTTAEAPVAKPKAPRKRATPAAGRRGGASVVYVDSLVETRVKAACKKRDITHLQLILEAVAANHDRLRDIVSAARINTRPVAELFEPDPDAVRYRGGGQIGVPYRPTPAQDAKLDEIGAELGFSQRSTWLAPVLEYHLRPRKKAPKAAADKAAPEDEQTDVDAETA